MRQGRAGGRSCSLEFHPGWNWKPEAGDGSDYDNLIGEKGRGHGEKC